jgi:hypothetical protein
VCVCVFVYLSAGMSVWAGGRASVGDLGSAVDVEPAVGSGEAKAATRGGRRAGSGGNGGPAGRGGDNIEDVEVAEQAWLGRMGRETFLQRKEAG